jgi:hypothetical protein
LLATLTIFISLGSSTSDKRFHLPGKAWHAKLETNAVRHGTLRPLRRRQHRKLPPPESFNFASNCTVYVNKPFRRCPAGWDDYYAYQDLQFTT